MAKPTKLVRFLQFSVLTVCILVPFIKIGLSDRYPDIAPIAYLPAVFLLFAGICLIVWCRRTNARILMLFAIGSVLLSIFLIGKENPSLFRLSQNRKEEGGTVRILQWNVWNVRKGARKIAEEIRKQNPQVICLNEARPRGFAEYPNTPNPFSTYLGKGWTECSDGQSLILSKLPMTLVKSRRWIGIQAIYVTIESDPSFTLLLVDLRSDPLLSRKAVLDSLVSQLAEWGVEPDLIAGDFNTPEGSYSLKSTLGNQYEDAYRIAGKGFGYTWPVWIPSLRIDLILAKTPASVLRHHIGYSLLSDHRWQWIDYEPK